MKTHPVSSLAFLFAAALMLSSCVVASLVRFPRQVPFDESEFVAYRGPGSATVAGRLTATYEGQASFAGGVPVSLIPVTAYTTEMVERKLGDGVQLTGSDPRFKKYVRLTRTDSQGGFAFKGVPAGEYYVAGEVEWNEAGSSDTYIHQWVCERVTVRGGEVVRITVSHNPQHGNSPVNNFWTFE